MPIIPATQYRDVLRDAAQALKAAGIESPAMEARLLLAHSLGWSQEQLLARDHETPNSEQLQAFQALLQRRLAHEPMAYLLGKKEFYGLDFEVSPATLIPRADTETLINAVLARFPDRSDAITILDLGTGSGCILVTLLSLFPQAQGVAVDRSSEALAVAQRNAARHAVQHRMRLLQGEWLDAIHSRFDVVVSNPPYIPQAEIAGLMPEVARYEPKTALDGGEDGLDAYRHIIATAHAALVPGGALVFEVGMGQAEAVATMLCQAGYEGETITQDLGGIARVVMANRPLDL